MGSNERWVGVDDVAAHLGVAKDSVYRWVETKGLPMSRLGRLFRFRLSEIDAWVESGGGEDEVRAASRGASGKRRPKGGRSR